MPRWYMEKETKEKLDLFKNKIELALNKPNMNQDELVCLLLKHDEKILDVIVTAESFTNSR